MHKVLLLTFMLILFNAAYGQQRVIVNKKNQKSSKNIKPLDTPSPMFTYSAVTGTVITCKGVASTDYDSFTLSGVNLIGDLTVTVPVSTYYSDNQIVTTTQVGWEITLTPNDVSTFSHYIALHPVNGVVNTTTIYARMSADNFLPQFPGFVQIRTDGRDATLGVNFPGTQLQGPDVDVNNQTICNNTATTKIIFKSKSEASAATSFPWVNDNPAIGLAASGTGDIPSFIGKNTGTEPLWANITVTPIGNCPGTSRTFHIIVNPTLHPILTVNTLTPVPCAGDAITFTVTPQNVGDLPIYKWLINGKPDGGNTITGDNTLVYTSDKLKNGDIVTCTVTGVTYCFAPTTSNPFVIKTIPLPEVHFSSSSYTINPGQSVQLNAIANSSVSGYSWSPITGLSNPNIANPIASPTATTPYTLTTSTAGGCTAVANITVNVVPKPPETDPGVIVNAFTPNGDGINDTWTIPKLANFPGCSVKIYNRYGGLVYQSAGYPKAWDGTFKSKPLPVGTYYYLIDLNTGDHPISGYVCILR